MSIITVNTNNNIQTIDFQDSLKLPYTKQLKLINELDNLLVNINKNKYDNAQKSVKYIKSIRSPEQINIFNITLLSLMDFFQKTYVTNIFKVKLNKIQQNIQEKLGWESINIIS